MSTIKIVVNQDTNYIYHMLSVAKCGYDNDYGKKYSCLHDIKDLEVLQDNSEYITVKGGEHCGELYGVLVAIPASIQKDIVLYYQALIDYYDKNKSFEEVMEVFKLLLGDSNHLKNFNQQVFEYFEKYKDIIINISKIMVNNYSIYQMNVWDNSYNELYPYALEVQKKINELDLCEKVEQYFNCDLPKVNFIATLCNSLSNGPEAIDISDLYDVFGIGRDADYEVLFIAHEYIIYTMLQIIPREKIGNDYNSWLSFEALAEFYLEKIIGRRLIDQADMEEKIKNYNEIFNSNNSLSIKQMYNLGLSNG